VTPAAATIVVGSDRHELDEQTAAALADHLWQGRKPGAVTSAAKLSDALSGPTPCTVQFEPHEVDAVRDGLVSLGIG